jgi:hypothetical protein
LLQASSGGTRTSPRTEAWSMMEPGFFSWSSSNFFWGGRRRRLNSLPGEWTKQQRGWASGRLAKTSRRGK